MYRNIKEDVKTNARMTLSVGWWIAVVVAFMAICSAAYLIAMPTFRNWWIKSFRSSNQYVTTKQTLLFTLYDEYERVETEIAELSTDESNSTLIEALRGQQKSILLRMRQEASLLQPDQVPYTIKTFLSEKGVMP